MSCNATQALQYNGDIAGLGVRLSFYFQNFILVLLVDRSYEDAESSLWTFIATSFGLTIAALVQVASNSLTLLEGILVSQLSWLANLGTVLALASYSRSKGEDNLVKIAAVLQGYISMILTIVMWVWSGSLPPGYSCNLSVKFVFFFAVHVPALGTGRIVGLVFSSLTMLVYTAVTYTECMAWRKHGISRLSPKETRPEVESAADTASRHARRGSEASGTRSSGPRRGVQSRRNDPARQKWLGAEVDPILFGIILTQLIIFAYFIATTELIVHQQGASDSDMNEWGFGQVSSHFSDPP
ncbi:hypothetical protein K439DRAFT_686237 [Ramaria rubella]|nr:hypothetical protein K439DRAFT_686237 [Ramaria rubella]